MYFFLEGIKIGLYAMDNKRDEEENEKV